MKVLFIGDIVGKTGRNAVKALLPSVVNKYKIDLVIANGENAAGGFGITDKIADELFGYGVHVITTGNHVWDKKEFIPQISKDRPGAQTAELSSRSPGIRKPAVFNEQRQKSRRDQPFRTGLHVEYRLPLQDRQRRS